MDTGDCPLVSMGLPGSHIGSRRTPGWRLVILTRQWMSSEVLSLALGQVVFPSSEVAALSPAPRAPRAAHYMSAMGLWRPLVGPGDPGPLPTSSCNSCMNCRYCFPDGPGLFPPVLLA